MNYKSDFLYSRIYADIIEQIKEGKLSVGEKIDKEVDLAEKYGVSRATVRKSLDFLCRMNLIYRVKKGGTFINGKMNFDTPQKIVPTVLPFTENLHRELISGIQATAIASNIFSPVYDTRSSYKHEREILENLYNMKIDGLILYPCVGINNIDLMYKFKEKKTPVIFLDRRMPSVNFPLITSNNRQGMALATEYLIRLGHRKIAFFAINQNMIVTEQDRLQGYLETLTLHGIQVNSDYIFNLEALADRLVRFSPKQQHDYYGYMVKKNVEKLLDSADPPTAVVCLNDFLALNLLRLVAGKENFSVPRDLSVTGFDDVKDNRIAPPLTTIRQNFSEIGKTAIETVIKQIQGEPVPTENYIHTDLIVRGSTAPCKEIVDAGTNCSV